MDLNTENLAGLADITAAVLEERTTGEGVLRLEFAGWGTNWLEWQAPVTLRHGGRVLYHGRLVRVSRANEGGEVRTQAEFRNFFWLLERQTLGQQLAELAEAADGSGSGSGSGSGAGTGATAVGGLQLGRLARGQIGKHSAEKVPGGGWRVCWRNAVLPLRMRAPGWRVQTVSRAAAADEELSVEVSAAVAGRQVWAVTERTVTTASALWRLRRTAPDVQYLIDYEAGTVTAVALGELPVLAMDTSGGKVLRAGDIEPQYEAAVTGVALAYTDDGGTTELYTYPPGLDKAQDGVKVFQLSGRYYVESWAQVAEEYYKAANELQWGGTVEVLAAALEESPLGKRLCLRGPGTHESWHDMRAVVTACSWDFMAGTVEMRLGRDVTAPEFAEAEEAYDGGEPVEEFERNMSGAASGGFPWLPNESAEGSAGWGGGSGSEECRYEVEAVSLREPDGCSPGVDGWEQTWFGLVYSGNTNVIVARRQLMRFREEGGKVVLQVANQEEQGGTWEVA